MDSCVVVRHFGDAKGGISLRYTPLCIIEKPQDDYVICIKIPYTPYFYLYWR